jgi:hypothetical protein
MTHFNGAIKLINSSGGMEQLVSSYPHLKLQLLATAQMQIMLIILTSTSIDSLELVSRRSLIALYSDPKFRESYFIPSPLRLFFATYDTAGCARSIFQAYGRVSAAHAFTRERIISDILGFHPEDSTEDLRKTYYSSNNRCVETVKSSSECCY